MTDNALFDAPSLPAQPQRAAATKDVTAPILKSLTFPTMVDVSKGYTDIVFHAVADDENSGMYIWPVIVYFDKPFFATTPYGIESEQRLYWPILAGAPGPKNAFDHTTSVGPTTPSGENHITRVVVEDNAYNVRSYSASELNAMGIATTITITGTVTELVPPKLLGFNFPSTVDVGDGTAQLSFDIRSSDVGIGTSDATLWFDHPLLTSEGLKSSLSLYSNKLDTPNGATLTATLLILGKPGPYTVSRLDLVDMVGNKQSYTTAQLSEMGFASSLSLTGATPDLVAPAIASLDFNSLVHLETPTQMTLRAHLIETGIGTDSLVIHFDRYLAAASGSSVTLKREYAAGANDMIAWLNFSAAQPGTFNVTGVDAIDKAGNVRNYSPAELASQGWNTHIVLADSRVPDTPLQVSASATEGQLVLSMTVANLGGAANLLTFDLKYGNAMHFESWHYKGSSTAYLAAVDMVNGMGHLNLAAMLNPDSGAGNEIELEFSTATRQATIAYEVTSVSLGSGPAIRPIANLFGQYSFLLLVDAHGTAANDRFSGSPGDDRFDGGGGIDTVLYQGRSSDFTITLDGGGATVAGAEGRDSLTGVERLHFADTDLALDLNGAAGQAYRIYQAAFNRTPDPVGLGYWIAMMDGGSSLAQVAEAFVHSAEFTTLYGEQPSNGVALARIYQNVLHRAPDADGFFFWLGALDSKLITLPGLLASFSESPENQAALIGVIGHGIPFTHFA
ncbi:MAG: DUF4214 domain-containing protein [Pseudomonadota bacterium]